MKPLKLLALLLVAGGICPFATAQEGVSATVTIEPVPATGPVAADAFHLLDEARAQNEDKDLQFIRDLMTLNEAAKEAAKAVLKTSYDADIRMMAGDSMKVHDAELRTLKNWLALHGPVEPQTTQQAALTEAPAISGSTPPAIGMVVDKEPAVPRDLPLSSGTR